jgi:hypothetical protein
LINEKKLLEKSSASFYFDKNKKAPATSHSKDFFYKYEQRGWEKSFTGQTKGYMFVVINFTYRIYHGAFS